MTPAEHRLEAERLHRVANALQRSDSNTPEWRLYCVTMAHAKRLQAQWHERRTSEYRWSVYMSSFDGPHIDKFTGAVSLQPATTMMDLLRTALGPDVALYTDRYGNIHSTREIR